MGQIYKDQKTLNPKFPNSNLNIYNPKYKHLNVNKNKIYLKKYIV